jgi:hypothetical protein
MQTLALFVLALLVQQPPEIIIRASVQGETNLSAPFVEAFRRELAEERLRLEIVPRSHEALDYNIVLAQETGMSGAAAAVIALDPDGDVVASVVRSGRLSGKGAMNACTKEIAKKIATLKR